MKQYLSTNILEKKLGSTNNPENIFSPQKILALDEKAKFPLEQAKILDEINFSENFIPSNLGGRLHSFESLVSQFKSIFRRDATLGLGYGITSFMGAVAGMFFGDKALKDKMAATLKNKQTISVAYHEKLHGNDLLHNEVTGNITDNYLTLSGEKWVINNAETSVGLTVFCKTSNQGGPKGFSLIYVDKTAIDYNSIHYLEKIKTLGVKGCRISGISFDNTKIALSSVIANIGDGFDLTLKAFQITRATVPGMSIGIVDTGLREVLRFAANRNLYRANILSLPNVYQNLVSAFIKILICDAVSIMAARALHVIPEQMSVISAIAKFYVPKTLHTALNELSVILGARHYIREETHAIFQKLLRDYPVIALGHASDVICAFTILPQLKDLLQKQKVSEKQTANLQKIFNLIIDVPEFDPTRLRIVNFGKNDIVNSIALVEDALNSSTYSISSHMNMHIRHALKEISQLIRSLKEKSLTIQLGTADFNTKCYSYVEQYCQAHVALSCIHFWIQNQTQISTYFDEGIWLILALQMINRNFISLDENAKKDYEKLVLGLLIMLEKNGQAFSHIPINFQ